jgi:hypothetical protein
MDITGFGAWRVCAERQRLPESYNGIVIFLFVAVNPLWPGTGEVGTTLGKESGNALITIVVQYYSRKSTSV